MYQIVYNLPNNRLKIEVTWQLLDYNFRMMISYPRQAFSLGNGTR